MRNIITILVLVFIHSISLNVFGHGVNIEDFNYNKGEVIVEYKTSDFLHTSENNLNCNYGQFSKKILEENGLSIKDSVGNIALVTFDENRSIDDVISLLYSDPNTKTAEPNYLSKIALNSLSTNDFFGDEQRGMSYISWPEAYKSYGNKLKGGSQVVVGVIDAGINYNHVDLKGSMWNSSSCRLNGKSVSCNHGYDLFYNNSTPLPVGDNHGTHIAGIIAATANNTQGMVGVNPYAKIASLKVTDNFKSIGTSFDDFSILKAIDFSIENGIKIINASYGGLNYSETMEAKIKEFGEHGGLFITTAMNDGIDIDRSRSSYPCSYNLDNIICVTAVNSWGNRPSFANYGSKSVDIAAPGEGIVGTISNPQDMYSYFEDFSSSCNRWSRGSCGYGDNYQFNEGVNSPTYSISSNSTYILKFDASCGGYTNFKINIYGNGGLNSSLELNNITSNKNEYKIPIPSGISSFSFSIEKDDGSTCYLDNVGIYPAKYYGNESDSYDLWDGTSMATAFVSGLASLVRTLNPDLSPIQVKRLILENGDSNSNFQGITVSGKTINVKKTLDNVTSTSRSTYTSTSNDNYSYSNNYSSQSSIDDFMASLVNESYGTNYNQPQYSSEMLEAFEFASNNGIISASSIHSADMDGYLTRIGMAKILSQFAINVLGLQPDYNKHANYYDVSDSLDTQYDNGVTFAYQLGIMGIDTHYFRPYDRVTRAEFATAVSRMVYNIDDGRSGRAYYEPHLYKLLDEGILNNIDPFRIEKRGLALVILKRIAQQNNFVH